MKNLIEKAKKIGEIAENINFEKEKEEIEEFENNLEAEMTELDSQIKEYNEENCQEMKAGASS